MPESIKQYDIVIVGGGLIGMSLAAVLADAPLAIALLEKNQPAPQCDSVLDLRTTGLTRSTQQIFMDMGIWPQLAAHATAVECVNVSEQGNFGGARIDAKAYGLAPIGYMIPNCHLLEVLRQKVARQKNLSILSPASLTAVTSQSHGGRQIQVDTPAGNESMQCSMLIGADGSFSKVRELLAIHAQYRPYHQTAVITNVRPQKAHQNTGYERFTRHGPLAVLPVKDNCCALIWTHAGQAAGQYMALSDTAFLKALQQAFGYRLGTFLQVGKRSAYPLALHVSESVSVPGAVLIGNAAQTVHPVAAQGFNLGLRDVQALASELAGIDYAPQKFSRIWSGYAQKRRADRNHVIRLTDGLTRLFVPQMWPAKLLRSVGISMLSNLPPVQRSLLRRNSGLYHFAGHGQ